MIFVTVGTQYQGFERLIKKMDEIAGRINEEVIAQIGSTKYKPKNLTYFTIKDENEILELFEKARIIVSHAGSGSLLTLINYMKPIIVVPRLKKFNEHIDNHQVELAEPLKNNKKFILVYDMKNLEDALKKGVILEYDKNKNDKKLINYLKKILETMKNENMYDDINSVSP